MNARIEIGTVCMIDGTTTCIVREVVDGGYHVEVLGGLVYSVEADRLMASA